MKQVVDQQAILSELGGIQFAVSEITFIKKGILCLFRGMKVDYCHRLSLPENSAATC